MMLDLLQAVVQEGTGRAARIRGVAVAGKTGTSQDYRDAWFVGFTPDLVVGVWVGNDDNTPTRGVVGGDLPAGIWNDFMTRALPAMKSKPLASAKSPAAGGSPSTTGVASVVERCVAVLALSIQEHSILAARSCGSKALWANEAAWRIALTVCCAVEKLFANP